MVDAIAYQVRDVVDAMTAASGTRLAELRVDGGASVMDLLLSDPGRPARRRRMPPGRPRVNRARSRVRSGVGRGRLAIRRCCRGLLGGGAALHAHAGPSSPGSRDGRPHDVAARGGTSPPLDRLTADVNVFLRCRPEVS